MIKEARHVQNPVNFVQGKKSLLITNHDQDWIFDNSTSTYKIIKIHYLAKKECAVKQLIFGYFLTFSHHNPLHHIHQ